MPLKLNVGVRARWACRSSVHGASAVGAELDGSPLKGDPRRSTPRATPMAPPTRPCTTSWRGSMPSELMPQSGQESWFMSDRRRGMASAGRMEARSGGDSKASGPGL